jgi:hypothetical protein
MMPSFLNSIRRISHQQLAEKFEQQRQMLLPFGLSRSSPWLKYKCAAPASLQLKNIVVLADASPSAECTTSSIGWPGLRFSTSLSISLARPAQVGLTFLGHGGGLPGELVAVAHAGREPLWHLVVVGCWS